MDFWIIYAKGEPGRCLPVTFSSEKRDDAELGYSVTVSFSTKLFQTFHIFIPR